MIDSRCNATTPQTTLQVVQNTTCQLTVIKTCSINKATDRAVAAGHDTGWYKTGLWTL